MRYSWLLSWFWSWRLFLQYIIVGIIAALLGIIYYSVVGWAK